MSGRVLFIRKELGSHRRILRRAGGRGHVIPFVFHKADFLCSPENGLEESGEDKIDLFLSPLEEMTTARKRW